MPGAENTIARLRTDYRGLSAILAVFGVKIPGGKFLGGFAI